jgi:formate hydrogenlyase subunit 6/NADH:ubiquinone oxidoreductase subunit I
MSPSNYEVHVEAETCKACGKCVKRCPMDAFSLESHPKANNKAGKISTLNPERCIGCGVCVYGCPTDSLNLLPRKTISDPPVDVLELKQRYSEERTISRKSKGLPVDDDYMVDISSGEAIPDERFPLIGT